MEKKEQCVNVRKISEAKARPTLSQLFKIRRTTFQNMSHNVPERPDLLNLRLKNCEKFGGETLPTKLPPVLLLLVLVAT